ncbi:hypothetical protein G205_15260 [Arthrobacter nitrophenolicus]|uniref:Uncharacterized protein n=1 Tax=Arthrobacter nitrophenolicus TaxID=683150 RepID=L8TMI6_9MICC|nr:hypothetical protein G205_15260 [Arthrobacter nitrophenolicus]
MARRRTLLPGETQAAAALTEGWIHLPACSLEELAD